MAGMLSYYHGWVEARKVQVLSLVGVAAYGHLGLSPRSASNGARGQSSPMISARMMPDRKSKVDCSTCRTADPARNPCPSNGACPASSTSMSKPVAVSFFSPFPPKEPEASMVRNGNPRCQVGYIYWDASAHGDVHPRLCSLIIPPTQYISTDRQSHKRNTAQKQHHAFSCLPRHQPAQITQHPTQTSTHTRHPHPCRLLPVA